MAELVESFVGQQTTSTGTGDIALSGAIDLHASFASKMSIGDTAEIVVRDDTNGAWLRCIATYSATNTLTRTTFLESSTGANISFSAGTKLVYVEGPLVRNPTEVLTASRTYYVNASTGADSNDGLGTGSAWASMDKVLSVVSKLEPYAGYSVSVFVADGTYGSGGGLPIQGIRVPLYIEGNVTTPANVVFNYSVDVDDCLSIVSIGGIGLASTGNTIRFRNSRRCEFYSSTAKFVLADYGAQLLVSEVAFSGATQWAIRAVGHSRAVVSTCSVSGTPAYSGSFASVADDGLITFSNAPTGSATGARYGAESGGMICTFGGGASFLPGNATGTTALGGQYV